MSDVDVLTTQVVTLTSQKTDLSKLMVSKKSCVYDLIWDFTEDLVHRPRSIPNGKLLINWEKWPFSQSFRWELQHIFALYRIAPRTLSKKGKEIKPQTLVAYIERSLNFLCDALQSLSSADLFDSLEQVKITDLQEAVKVHPGSSPDIKRGLGIVFHPYAAKVLDRHFSVTQADIKGLPIKPRTRKTPENLSEGVEGPALFSDDLFALLSDQAAARVQDFLRRIGINAEDDSTYMYEAPEGVSEVTDFGEVFYVYEQMRRGARGLLNDDLGFKSNIRHHLRKRVRPARLKQYLTEVNLAAQCLIGLYVGPRFSELASFEVGCLTERDGISCIVGRNFKSKRDKNLIDDAWVAVPVVRDAVRVLERLACIKNNRFLFSSLATAGGRSYDSRPVKNSGLSYTNNGFRHAMSRFIEIADTQGLYNGWRFNSHQFKHSIARQLVKAKLGLPYISFHLKHLHNRISALPSEVTLGYGNAGKIYQSTMAGYQIQEMKRDLARKMYDPDSPIQGGAAIEFDARRKSYFKGATDSGLSKDQVIDELAALGGSAFVNVGLGYCSGRKDDPVTGKKPPCIGSLRCNPGKCANAVITKEAHGAAWRRIAIENRNMGQDPRFAYGKEQFRAAAEEAEGVCRQLGVEVDNE